MLNRRRRYKVPPSIVVGSLWKRRPVLSVIVIVLLGVVAYDRIWPRAVGGGRSTKFQSRDWVVAQEAAIIAGDFALYHDKTFAVARVVDGDTIDLNVPDGAKPTTRVRLWGVDTPEVEGSDRGPMYFGPAASNYAKRILEGNKVHIVLSPKDTRGKYGRLLAYVYLDRDGPMFNEMLLETGHAYADTRFKHHYLDKFKLLEKHARNNSVGLWAQVETQQMPAWRQRSEKR